MLSQKNCRPAGLNASPLVAHAHQKHSRFFLQFSDEIFFLDVFFFVDTIFMVMYRKMNWFDMQVLHPPTSKLYIFTDLLSVIPFDLLYFVISADPNMRLVVILRLRYALRVTRFISEIKRLRNLIGSNTFINILMEYVLIVTLTLFLSNCIGYLVVCARERCSHLDVQDFLKSLYDMVGKVTMRCFHANETIGINILYVCLITNLSMYIYLKGFIIAKFVNAFKQYNLPKGLFSNTAQFMYKRYRNIFAKDQLLKTTLQMYYVAFWKTRHGVLNNAHIVHILPEIRRSEIQLDLSWKCFQHSQLFRGEELHFLHHLAQFVQNGFKSAGEILYKKGEIKSRMIYVVAGIIQFYSDEDGETPILSFSGGTVLGESALIVSTQSVCTVVCKSDCEIDVLEAKDFTKVMKRYPEKYEKFRKVVYQRFAEAKSYHEVKAFQRELMNVKESSQLLTMKWLKMTLNVLLSREANYFHDYLKTLNIEDRLLAITLTKLLFCPNYLDLLVLTKQTEFMGDRIFVKSTFPCILQPESILIRLWEKFVSIAVLIFIFVYPLYMAYYRQMTFTYSVFITFITFIWALDIFIQVSTAIHARTGLITSITQITGHRMTETLFVLDVFAVVPLELVTIILTGYDEPSYLIALQVNRVLKIAKLENLFVDRRNSINTNMLLVNCLKCTLYLIVLVYWIAALIFLLILQAGVEDNSYETMFDNVGAKSEVEELSMCVFLATILVTGLNFYLPDLYVQPNIFYVTLSLVAILIIILYLLFFSNITATESIRVHGNLILKEYYKDIKFILKSSNFDEDFSERMLRYTNHQWLTNSGIDFLQKDMLLQDIPRELFLIIRRYSLLEYVENVPLFQQIPRKLLTDFCGYFSFWDIPAGQVITYAGEVASELYIISAGYCQTTSADGQIRRIITTGDSFAVVETCLKVPIVNSVIAVTDCIVISLTYRDFVHAFSMYPKLYTDFKHVTEKALSGWTQHEIERDEIEKEDYLKVMKTDENSFVHFGYRLDPDSEQGKDYYLPFERLGYWSFLRYLLLRFTIRCNGRFACYWEIFRCITCFLSVILNSIPFMATCTDCVIINWILNTLDIIVLIDMYIRHHITYFDERGVEVTHPIKTATYYWKHSFIVDLMVIIPFLHLIELIYGSRLEIAPVRAGVRYNKLLQMYRIIEGMNYLRERIDAKVKLWTVLMYIPIVIVGIVYSAAFAFNLNCKYRPTFEETEIFGAGVKCDHNSWLGVTSDVIKPIGLFRVALYSIYYLTSITTGIAIHGFYITNIHQAIVVTIFAFTGFLCFEFISAKIIAINLSRNVNLTVYQEATRVLMRFLNLRRIDEKLRMELIEHFEYVFSKMRGVSYETIFSHYNNALKEEAMFKLFGSVMKESMIFRGANPSFFRSLLLHVKHQIYLRRGIISRVNDVSGSIFFVFKGEVEVLGPDYNRLLVLPKGSIFGNLDEIAYSRRTLTVVAKGHVELLEIDTMNFYTVLNRYIKLKMQFKKFTMVNTDYLIGGKLPKITQISFGEEKKQERQRKDLKHSLRIKHKTILGRIISYLFSTRHRSKTTKIWDFYILFVVCFFGAIVEMYRVTMKDHALTLTIILYLFDFFYIVRIYINFHMSFTDEMGAFMTNRRAIIKHYMRERAGFRIDILTVIPFEFIAFIFFLNPYIFWTLFIYCRCNRFIRLFFVFDYFRKTNKKVSINVHRVKALEMLVIIILTLQIATAVVIHLGCIGETNTYPEMICNFDDLSSSAKFKYFTVQLSNVVSVFTATSFRRYYPNSAIMIVLLIMYMLMCRILIMIFMAEICATWEVIQNNRHVYERAIKQYKKLITRQGLSPVLIEKTWAYFRLLWGKQSGQQFPNLLEEAPYYLREAVLNSMFGYHLRNHDVLKNCHVDLIRQMAARMRTRIFFPGDYIALKNDIDECMYFIQEGEIFGLSVDTLRKEVVDRVFKAGDMFGLNQGMYARIGHDYTYKVNQYSILVVLKRTSWIHLLDFYPASKVLIFDENFVQ